MNRMYLVLAVFAVGVAAALGEDDDVSANCPNNLPYTSAMKFFHGTCYQFVSQEKFWQQARDFCLMNGGRLVKVDDPQTNDFIVESLNALWWRNQGVWIGLHDITAEMQWQWTGYELHTNEPMLWNNWGRGHPGAFLHSRRDCVRMVRGGGDWKWHETMCHALRWHYRFICEYKANVSSGVATSINLQVFRRPNSANQESPASDNSMLEGFEGDEGHSWHSGEVRAVADEQKAVGGEEKNNGSGIIAMAIGCLLIGTLVIIIAFVLYRRRQRLHRYVENDQNTVSKGKHPVDDDAMTEETKSARSRAVANIYVTADGNGHATTRLASGPQPDVIVDSDTYEEGEEYDDYDDGEEGRQDTQVETPTNEGELDGLPVEYDKAKSSNIYFEIPDNDDYPDSAHIYEALDEVKK